MTPFLLVAAALTIATIAIVGRALWRTPAASARASRDELNAAICRDQLGELDAALAQGTLTIPAHAEARDALRRRLAEELAAAPAASGAVVAAPRATALASGLVIALGAIGLYAWLGNPGALAPQATVAKNDAHGLQGDQIAGMVQRLAARLQDNPENVDGWVMLARSYSAMGRFEEAARAYGQAAQRAPGDANILADYADVAAMAQGRRFEGEPDRIIARALAADGRHVKSLALAGSSAFARKDYEAAVGYWTRLRDRIPAESDMARSVETSIGQARRLAAGARAAAAPASATPVAAKATAGPAGLSGTVSLAPALTGRVQPGDTLFIYARATEGPRMPLAIVRRPVGEWPVDFVLDDANAMSAAARLSQQREVVLEARISRSGSATAVRGDLHGSAGTVAIGRKGIAIEIGAAVE